MKTLIFCTGYAPTADNWQQIHQLWINTVKKSGLVYDQLLIPDDGSPSLPTIEGAVITSGAVEHQPEVEVVIHKFADNLGRPSLFDCPGWYRSFTYAGWYAHKFRFEKVIHIEADACVISRRFVDYLNNFKDGWEAFWCPRHRISEAALQVVAGSDCVEAFSLFSELDYNSNFKGRAPDPYEGQGSYLPYSTNRTFIGDRYGEYASAIPIDADYACQVHLNLPRWWMGEDTQ